MKGHLHLPHPHNQRLQRIQVPTYERLQACLAGDHSEPTKKPLGIRYGWGCLLIGQTYPDAKELARGLLREAPGKRDIALYAVVPQQVLAHAPQQLLLGPSDALRLWFTDYHPARHLPRGSHIRRVYTGEGWAAIGYLYLACGTLPMQTERLSPRHQDRPIYRLAEDADTGVTAGAVMGLNHAKVFRDPEGGPSLWCLAVDPQCSRPDVGEALVRHLAEYFMSRELTYLDLSVLHNNQQIEAFYRKFGFRRLAIFTIKRKSGIDQSLFLGSDLREDLNPCVRIIVDEAHRCGIEMCVDGAESGLFTLTQSDRQIRCRESFSGLTTAVSMILCQDKVLTHHALQHTGLRQSQQHLAGSMEENTVSLVGHGSLVVKPVDGEQGQGVAVDLRITEEVGEAIETACHFDPHVLLESYHTGRDLRVLVIGHEAVAAAIRRPAAVIDDGRHNICELIRARDRRRQAATDGGSCIPFDHGIERAPRTAGYGYGDIPLSDEHLAVRRTANLHIGGILEDVTDTLYSALREATIRAVRALEIPVVGLDFPVETVDQPNYVTAEADERAGLANHEPQSAIEYFVGFPFPLSCEVSS